MVSPERLDALQQSWVKLLGRYNVSPREAYPPFDLLTAAYSAPDRHYHNLEHVAEMFRVTGRLTLFCDDPHAVQLAVWFHDAVYDPRLKDNEVRSAELVGTLLGPVGVPGGTVERVARMVRMTAHLATDQPAGDRDTAAMIDADLAILGAAEDRYRRYAADIRREYAWVPDPDYAAGRRTVLERFLARPRIFWHDMIYQEGEARARANLRAELDGIAAG